MIVYCSFFFFRFLLFPSFSLPYSRAPCSFFSSFLLLSKLFTLDSRFISTQFYKALSDYVVQRKLVFETLIHGKRIHSVYIRRRILLVHCLNMKYPHPVAMRFSLPVPATSTYSFLTSRLPFAFSILSLTLCLAWSSLILVGCTSISTRDLYLVSFKYNTNSESYKSMEQFRNRVNGINGVKDQALERDDEQTFLQIRVGYRALCLETTNGWNCARSANQLSNISQDPLHLVSIAGTYKDKIIRSHPLWISVSLTALVYIIVFINAIPPIPHLKRIPRLTKKISTVGAMILASISILAAMVVSRVGFTSTTTIIGTLTVGAIEVHTGGIILAFGWTLFILTLFLFALTLSLLVIFVVYWECVSFQLLATHQWAGAFL